MINEKDVMEVIDKVEDDYIDPLKKKVDEYSEKPLSFLKKHGAKMVLIFVGVVVVAAGILIAIL